MNRDAAMLTHPSSRQGNANAASAHADGPDGTARGSQRAEHHA